MEVTAASVLLLPFAAASVGVARRRLVSDLIAADVYDSAVCDVALVISELFSNALRHAAPLALSSKTTGVGVCRKISRCCACPTRSSLISRLQRAIESLWT